MQHENEPTDDYIKVELCTIGGEAKTVTLNGDRTVKAALLAGGFNGNEEVRVGGENYLPTDTVEDKDSMIVVNQEKPKGASL